MEGRRERHGNREASGSPKGKRGKVRGGDTVREKLEDGREEDGKGGGREARQPAQRRRN